MKICARNELAILNTIFVSYITAKIYAFSLYSNNTEKLFYVCFVVAVVGGEISGRGGGEMSLFLNSTRCRFRGIVASL